MGSWKKDNPRKLKKIVYALTESNIKQIISDHEDRGWVKASEIKEHGYGLGCLMVWSNESQLKEG